MFEQLTQHELTTLICLLNSEIKELDYLIELSKLHLCVEGIDIFNERKENLLIIHKKVTNEFEKIVPEANKGE